MYDVNQILINSYQLTLRANKNLLKTIVNSTWFCLVVSKRRSSVVLQESAFASGRLQKLHKSAYFLPFRPLSGGNFKILKKLRSFWIFSGKEFSLGERTQYGRRFAPVRGGQTCNFPRAASSGGERR
jgi:hypothetical protein